MEYITVKDGIITGHGAAADASRIPEGAVAVRNFCGVVGDRAALYDESWNRLTDEVLYERGLLEVPEGFRWSSSDGGLVEMSLAEKVAAGLERLEKGMKIVDGRIELMSVREMVDAGQMSLDDAKRQARAERNARLEETDRYMLSDFPIGDAERAAVKEYRDMLRHLPEKDGFPFVEILEFDIGKIKEMESERN